MITHIVSFRWKPETTAAQIERICEGLATLPDLVPTIKTYRFGSDLGVGPDTNMQFAIVATFDSVEDWQVYDTQADHERVRAEIIRPWIAERAAVQFRS